MRKALLSVVLAIRANRAAVAYLKWRYPAIADNLTALQTAVEHERDWEGNVRAMREYGSADPLSLKHAERELARYKAERYRQVRICENIVYWRFIWRRLSVHECHGVPAWQIWCACH